MTNKKNQWLIIFYENQIKKSNEKVNYLLNKKIRSLFIENELIKVDEFINCLKIEIMRMKQVIKELLNE